MVGGWEYSALTSLLRLVLIPEAGTTNVKLVTSDMLAGRIAGAKSAVICMYSKCQEWRCRIKIGLEVTKTLKSIGFQSGEECKEIIRRPW